MYVTVTMQMMVIATIIKTRAQEFVEATTWIQEDLENIKYQATNYQYTLLKTKASSTDKSLELNSVDNFKDGDDLIIGTDYTNNKIASSGVNNDQKKITLKNEPLGNTLGTNWLPGTPVAVITRCNPLATNAGFADGLRDLITDTDHSVDTPVNTDIPKTSNVTKKTFRLKRTTSFSSNFPYNMLQVNYDVSPTSSDGSVSGPSIAKFYIDVIPNAALQCPS